MPEIMDKQILKALSTDTRQEIIKLLAKRPYTASELSSILKKHVTTITEHLNVLENSGLINKKESSNKWVYYQLSNKGEKIFKPTYYSWVVVLSISLLCLLVGFQQVLLSPGYSAMAATGIEERADKMPLETSFNATSITTTIDYEPLAKEDAKFAIGIVLISASLIGFSYLIIKKLKENSAYSKTIPA